MQRLPIARYSTAARADTREGLGFVCSIGSPHSHTLITISPYAPFCGCFLIAQPARLCRPVVAAVHFRGVTTCQQQSCSSSLEDRTFCRQSLTGHQPHQTCGGGVSQTLCACAWVYLFGNGEEWRVRRQEAYWLWFEQVLSFFLPLLLSLPCTACPCLPESPLDAGTNI